MKVDVNPFSGELELVVGTGGGGGGSGTLVNIKEDNAVIVANATDLNFNEPDATLVTASGTQANVNMAKYLLLTGRAGGQTAFGGTGATDELVIGANSTSPASIHAQLNALGQTRLVFGAGNDPTTAFAAGGLLQFIVTADQNVTGVPAFLGAYSLNTGFSNGTTFFGIGANGTFASPTASVDGDILLQTSAFGFDSTNTMVGNPAAVHILYAVDGTPTAGIVPGQLILFTNDAATGVGFGRLWIRQTGTVGIGNDFYHSTALLHVRTHDPAMVVSNFQGGNGQTADLTEWSARVFATVSVAASAGATTLTLVSSTQLDPSGVIYIANNDPIYRYRLVAYTANNTGTGVLTLAAPLVANVGNNTLVYQPRRLTYVDLNGNLFFTGGDNFIARGFIEVGTFDATTPTNDAPAPAAGKFRLYARDNGAGKTQAVIRFNTGAVQVIATQP